jgi:tRNA-dihydrouridine synthase B
MDEKERPIAQQICGSDLDSFVAAAKKIEEVMHPDIIDINMGCPVPKVALRAQAGSALLKDPDKIEEIIKAVVDAVSVPVTVKMRLGWDSEHINCVEIAKRAEKAGASAIALHARTRAQGYSGVADWSYIKKVKEAVNIPVIGNGDVTSCYKAKEMLDQTGCDAVMIGRGVLGNPWLIKECVDYLEKGTEPDPNYPSEDERIEMLKHHFDLLAQDKDEKTAILEIRTHALSYIKGLPGNAAVKNAICQTKTKKEMFDILENYINELKKNSN